MSLEKWEQLPAVRGWEGLPGTVISKARLGGGRQSGCGVGKPFALGKCLKQQHPHSRLGGGTRGSNPRVGTWVCSVPEKTPILWLS